jgi:hypothetical protein
VKNYLKIAAPTQPVIGAFKELKEEGPKLIHAIILSYI